MERTDYLPPLGEIISSECSDHTHMFMGFMGSEPPQFGEPFEQIIGFDDGDFFRQVCEHIFSHN